MKAEIISIGTELLLGQTVNTNACFIANELQSTGIESYFQTTVGDNVGRIHQVLNIALERADIIITTGGLGPTSDDLTHKAISSFFKSKLTLDKVVLKKIQKKFYLKGYKKMPGINIKQAYKPKDAKWIPNKTGTANGIIWKVKDKITLTFPGVPSEMKQMWEDTVKPYLKKQFCDNVFYSKVLKFTGIGESALAEKIKPYFKLNNPTIAPYASIGEVKIRITSRSKTLKKARKVVTPVVKKILAKLKDYYFGEDDESLEYLVAKQLTTQKKTLAVAESCTGGLMSKRLTDVPGSSKYTKFNLITYSNEAKNKHLQVPKIILSKYGAVSSQVAGLMALGIKKLSSSDIGISITGIAGPSGSKKTKPVGLVYFGIAKGKEVKTSKVFFGSNSSREEIRWLATQHALNWLRLELNK